MVRSSGAQGSGADVLAVLTGELVNNAVLHAGTAYTVSVRPHREKAVRVEVQDRSDELPKVGQYQPDAISGRGLQIVAALADRWGVHPTPPGKTVWFEFRVEAPGES